MEKYKILLFDGSNFGNWKFRIETLLNELEFLEFAKQSFYSMIEFLENDTSARKQKKCHGAKDNNNHDKKSQ